MPKTYLLVILAASAFALDHIPPEENAAVRLDNELRAKLSQEERNAECCRKRMRCCRKRLDPPDIEIRALLVRCPRNPCSEGGNRRVKQPLQQQREESLRSFQGFDEDEPLVNSEVKKCHKKMLITMRIKNAGPTNCKNVFVVVDHVYDPATSMNARLLYPYVIKIKQEPITEMYKLRFQHVVNSEAREVVYNKHDGNYTGCDTTSNTPTCGVVKYNGKVVPYSTGFCCSCDALVNNRRQPEPLGSTGAVISYSDPATLLENVQCPRNLKGNNNEAEINMDEKTIDELKSVRGTPQETKSSPTNDFIAVLDEAPPLSSHNNNTAVNAIPLLTAQRSQDQPLDIEGAVFGDPFNQNVFIRRIRNELPYDVIVPTGKNLKRKVEELERLLSDQLLLENQAAEKAEEKRQVVSSGNQRRGGQNCADRYTPPKLDPGKYHESTHCLKFSDLWYTVYQLHEPLLEHSFYVQVFEKHEDVDGNTRWRDLTKGRMIRMGMFNPSYKDEDETVAFHYKSKVNKPDEGEAINYKNARLLIPEGTSKLDPEQYPEITGGPPEYLVVQQNQISMDGDQCNIAGVGYEAFVKQPNRCSVPRGSCLANQPRHLWSHDRQKEMMGKKGCFFLKNYGTLSKVPIRQNSVGQDRFLAFEYSGKHYSLLDMEIKADFNTVLLKYGPGKITEVYVDSTSATRTVLTVKVTNSGLVSGEFFVGLSDCPLEMPSYLNNIKSTAFTIAPQHQHIFNLEINYELPVDRFHCSIEAFNGKSELVAIRRIRIQKFDRCICTWHCLCACLGSTDGLKCRPMSLEHYHAAGFQGALPIATVAQKYTLVDEIISWSFYFLVFMLLTFLFLGLAKAIVGCCCCAPVGIWGLDLFLGLPRKMNSYYESELRGRRVVYDKKGWPVHPDDCKRRVRNVSRVTEFCMNVVFFYTYPVTVVFVLLRRLCCPFYVYEDEDVNEGECFKRMSRPSIARCSRQRSRPCASGGVSFEDVQGSECER